MAQVNGRALPRDDPPLSGGGLRTGDDMKDARYDVIAIGNAIVDVIAPCSDELIEH
jgi:hypothetical protein